MKVIKVIKPIDSVTIKDRFFEIHIDPDPINPMLDDTLGTICHDQETYSLQAHVHGTEHLTVSYDKIVMEYGDRSEESMALAQKVIDAEAKCYRAWRLGDVFCYYEINDDGFAEGESCYGFYSVSEAIAAVRDTFSSNSGSTG